MSNTYKALSPAAVAAFADGVFEREFSPSEEKDHLTSGLLELVPRTYRAMSNNYAAAKQGETFEAAYLVENERALIQGGHIERVAVGNVGQSSRTGGAVTPPESKKAGK